MDLADQAMRSQNAAMDKLSQQSATNVNSQARLEAVEAEIKDLKAKADAALEREKAARDEAEAKKAQVDQLIADTTRLDAELQAAKPGIQSQMAAVEASQNAVANEIAERDRRLREAWEAEQRRIAEAAAAAAAAPAAAQGQAPPPQVPTSPVTGSPSAFGLRHPFAGGVPITSGFGWRSTPPGTIDFYGTGRLRPHRHRLRRRLRHPCLRCSGRRGLLLRLELRRRRRLAGEDLPRRGAGQLPDHDLLPQQQHRGLQRPAGIAGPAHRLLGQHRQLDGLPRTL